MVYLLEPNDLTLGLKRKKVRIYDYPDGTIEIRYDGHPLPYSVFDKVQEITPTEIVNNKRWGSITVCSGEAKGDGIQTQSTCAQQKGSST